MVQLLSGLQTQQKNLAYLVLIIWIGPSYFQQQSILVFIFNADLFYRNRFDLFR